ncbi:MAG TPA: LysR family transcriptional regulator [Burkholderiaceae bacterium]|nr:LysR family transcriptional regulator [Burkholderiaceae bacterium]
MEFRQLQYFVCLYEEGSVTRAARRLNIVQPALSMQIAKLEDEVGELLFVRSPQGMRPTPRGRDLYRLFLPVVGDFARARERAMHVDGELSGQVRVGVIATIAQSIVPDAMIEFANAHPRVHLTITDGYSQGLSDAVSVDQLDAALINKPRRPLALTMEPIVDEELVLVTGPKHGALDGTIRFAEVGQLKLALPTRQHGLRGILESFAQGENVDLSAAAEVDSIAAILGLVEHSDFATVLPRIAVMRSIEAGRVVAHSIVSPSLVRKVVCVTHPRRPLAPATAAFIEVLARRARPVADAGITMGRPNAPFAAPAAS